METSNKRNNGWVVIIVLAGIVCVLALTEMVTFFVLRRSYNTIRTAEILWILRSNMKGANIAVFKKYIIAGVLVIAAFVALYTYLFSLARKGAKVGRFALLSALVSTMLFLCGAGMLYKQLCIGEYIHYRSEYSEFIEDNWVDARETDITFNQKRNLIFIFLESMEITFTGYENGGYSYDNYLPELTEIAKNNVNFSDGEKINGGYAMPDANYTIAAMCSMTSGIGVKEDFFTWDTVNATWNDKDYESDYLPGAYALGEILQDNGYYQELLIGSEADFGGRKSYFVDHGNYEIFDYLTAKEKGLIPQDYLVWWGYEDAKLYEYAKDELTRMSRQDEPFNLTMLTVDTHFTDGYKCQLCGDKYDYKYCNVYACASKQCSEFISWIQQQPFYENTTIIIAGDHPTEDSEIIDYLKVPDDYKRLTYFAVINPAEDYTGSKREFATYDIFPTTLAAIGADIEGDRLGLGTNLFSDKSTLVEEYGADYIVGEIKKRSAFYENGLAGQVTTKP